jgi:hypothetical protein
MTAIRLIEVYPSDAEGQIARVAITFPGNRYSVETAS